MRDRHREEMARVLSCCADWIKWRDRKREWELMREGGREGGRERGREGRRDSEREKDEERGRGRERE